MMQCFLLDTGPLVAFINPQDNWHNWASKCWSTVEPPFLTCEAVITEACFLLRNVYRGENAVLELVEAELIQLPFHLEQETSAICNLLLRYKSVPMSLADACLVRMAELYPGSQLLTWDSDFTIYRKNQNQTITLRMPP
jgi:predicted nucleic acid-binding protein